MRYPNLYELKFKIGKHTHKLNVKVKKIFLEEQIKKIKKYFDEEESIEVIKAKHLIKVYVDDFKYLNVIKIVENETEQGLKLKRISSRFRPQYAKLFSEDRFYKYFETQLTLQKITKEMIDENFDKEQREKLLSQI